MKTVAFIGLGIMGLPMATNLVAGGLDVIGYNRSTERLDELAGRGGRAATSLTTAVREADVVVTMLPDSPDVDEVMRSTDGVFATAAPGTLLIDMSTISPAVAGRLAADGVAHGLRILDAPVSGGEQAAISGDLSVMVGGSEDDFVSAGPVLEHLGRTIVHVGPAGSGQTVKAANQMIVAGTIQLVAEALVFLQAYDVNTQAAVKVLAAGLAGNAILDRKATGMLARDFAPGFRLALHHKDLGIASSAARDAGVTLPLGAVAEQLVGSMVARGHGGLDHTALITLVEDLSGRSIGQLPSTLTGKET